MSSSEEFISRTLTIKNKLGLHARAASMFVQVVNGFKSDVFIAKGSQEVNGKSIMGILILAAACGTEIEVKARGEDAEEALDAVEDLIDRRFDEQE